MISDIQVSLATGERFDILRKVHPVGPCLVLGFSGSVKIGFAMVENLRARLQLPPDAPANAMWIPAYVADAWASKAVAVFAQAEATERALGCKLLLVGVHPTETVGMPNARAYVIRMAAPLFRPGFSPKRLVSVLSIGSGSRVLAYRKTVREAFGNWNLFQAEVQNTGGWGRTIAHILSVTIERHLEPGISNHLHIADVRRGRITIYSNDRTDFLPNDEKQAVRMPRTASSYTEFCQMLEDRNAQGVAVIC